jgi:hypothetical protein
MAGNAVRVWRQDLQPGRLPPVCHATGEPTQGLMSYSFATSPGWTCLLILLGFVPFLIALLLTTKRARGVLPLIPERHLGVRIFRYGWALPLGVGLLVVVIGAALGDPSGAIVAWVGFLLLLASLLWLLCRNWVGVRGKVEEILGMPDAIVTLGPVHPNFAAAVNDMYFLRGNQAEGRGQATAGPPQFLDYPAGPPPALRA